MYTKLSITLFVIFLVASALGAQQSSIYRTARLLKIDKVVVQAAYGANPYKASYLLEFHDEGNAYYGLYNVSSFGHDYGKSLKVETDISYRVSGENLTIKTIDSHEIKARLCNRARNATQCGSVSFSDRD